MSKKTYSITEWDDRFAIVERDAKYPHSGGIVLGRIHKIRELAEQRLAVVLANIEKRKVKRRPAASPWRTDEPPKDGTVLLLVWNGCPHVGWNKPSESRGWVVHEGRGQHVILGDPTHWAHINMPEGE